MKTLRLLFVFSLGVCLGLAQPLISSAGERPNILFLFADDQRADTIGAHGNDRIETPHIDRLVRTGTSFRGHYIFGGNSGAVCVPSRAMLMTGKNWMRIDVGTLANERLLPELLREHGYATFGIGKWHNGPASCRRAFPQGKSFMFGGMSDHTKVPVRDPAPDGQFTEAKYAEKFSSELFADGAIDFLHNHDRSKPFFAYVAFTAPHDPRQPPPDYRERYYRNRPPLPPNFLPQHPFDNGMLIGRDEDLGAWPRTEAMIRDQLAEYYGMVSHLDHQIGRILATLKSAGLAENTIVIYSADNGLALGSHGLLGKQSVYEHSMKVPLIISGPGIPANESISAFTYSFDLFPTICELLGVPVPQGLDGKSLKPLLEKKVDHLRESVFLPYLDLQRAIRDERWKLIAYPKIDHLQLFDLKNDPFETSNLIDKPEHAEQVARLRVLMRRWQTAVGDPIAIPTANKKPRLVDLTRVRRVPDQWQPDWIVHKYFTEPRNP